MPHHQARRAQRPDGHAGPNQIRLDLEAVGPVEGDIVDQRTGPRLGRSDARFRHRHLLQRVAPLRRSQSPPYSQTHADPGRPGTIEPMPLISTSGLTKRYPRGVIALDGLTLDLEPGIIGLVGANGAGKSTLIKILLGPARADRGRRPGAGPRRPHRAAPTSASSSATCPSTTACRPDASATDFVDAHGADVRPAEHGRPRAHRRGPPPRRAVRGALPGDRRLLDRDEAAGEARPGAGPRSAACCCSTSRRTASTRPAATRCSRSSAGPAPSSGSPSSSRATSSARSSGSATSSSRSMPAGSFGRHRSGASRSGRASSRSRSRRANPSLPRRSSRRAPGGRRRAHRPRRHRRRPAVRPRPRRDRRPRPAARAHRAAPAAPRGPVP